MTGDGNVANTNSWLSGWSLGAGWQQQWVQSSTKDSRGNITIIVHGTATYSLFFEGVGTIYSYPDIYQIRITCDGQVSISQIHQ